MLVTFLFTKCFCAFMIEDQANHVKRAGVWLKLAVFI